MQVDVGLGSVWVSCRPGSPCLSDVGHMPSACRYLVGDHLITPSSCSCAACAWLELEQVQTSERSMCNVLRDSAGNESMIVHISVKMCNADTADWRKSVGQGKMQSVGGNS